MCDAYSTFSRVKHSKTRSQTNMFIPVYASQPLLRQHAPSIPNPLERPLPQNLPTTGTSTLPCPFVDI